MPSSTLCGFTDEQTGLGSCQFDEPEQVVVDCEGFSIARRWQHDCLNFLREEDGATAVEYAVMISLITGTVIGGFQALTTATLDSFETSAEELSQ